MSNQQAPGRFMPPGRRSPVFWISEYQRVYPLTARHHGGKAQSSERR